MDADLDVKGELNVEHLALYREWRPQTFREVMGQEHVCRTLQNAVRQNRVAHAYLFCGPRGTGKTSTARILAKAVNCPDSQDGEPCNTCSSCRSTTAGISMDVIEMDAASHRGIEEIRDLNQKVCFAPTAGKSRLFIIDEVHMLTGEAFNALLKTLEEPPRHTIFVLATTEAHKVPLTIMSRCQRFDFRRLSREVINDHLRRVAGEKGWQIDDDALELLSRHAGGALRDALGLLEQAASFTGGAINRADLETLVGAISPESLRSLLTAAMVGDAPSLLKQLDELSARGCEPRQVLCQLIDLVRDRLFATATPGPERTSYVNLLRGLAAADVDLKGNSRPDLVLELALVRFSDTPARSAAGAASASSGAGSSGPGAVRYASSQDGVPASGRQPGASAPGETPRAAVSKSVTAAIGAGKSAAAPAGQPSPREQATVAAPPGELRKVLGQVFQKQPLELQDLASCELEQNGNKLVLKTSSAFQQERLLKEENRRKLQEALRGSYPALELEITCDVRGGQRAAGKEGIGGADAQVRFQHTQRVPGSPGPGIANENLSSPGSPGARSQRAEAEASRARHPGAELEGTGEGQVDTVVGVALTLFNGKIIEEAEVG